MKKMKFCVLTLFIFLISCIYHGRNSEKEYQMALKRLKDTILITYKLDSSYNEIHPGIALWGAEDAKKYKKSNEILITFYNVEAPLLDKFSLKTASEIPVRKYGISENPFSTTDEYYTKFNNEKGFYKKSQSKKRFILSYYTLNEECQTDVLVVMEGNDFKNEDELVFKSLIESFTFKKN